MFTMCDKIPPVGRDRPFPWVCFECNAEAVFPQATDYTTTRKHDGRAYTIHIPDLELPTCRKCGAQTFSVGDDDCIVAALRAQVGLLTPEEIQKQRARLEMTQQELADHLCIAKETISRWETGGMIQSRAMDNLLRLYFESEEVRGLLRERFAPDLPRSTNGVAVPSVSIELFSTEYLDKAEQVFLHPTPRYSWEEIVNGVLVASPRGAGPRQFSAVGRNTFRGFHKINKNWPGANEAFRSYFTHHKTGLLAELSRLENEEQLHQLENRVCEEVKSLLTNIKPGQLQSYNKVRKPVDLYIMHLVAMATELDGSRERLAPLLFLPLDSQILCHQGLFVGSELQKRWSLPQTPTFQDVRTEKTYQGLQQLLQEKAGAVAGARGRPLYRIYFDLLWGNRASNWGGNLFETNPLSENYEESRT
jgi:putative zinc finger/helix-turn-helix YgiT family protein